MIPLAEDYRTARGRFRWNVPEHYNIAHDVCDRHARGSGDRTALVVDDAGSGETREWTFRQVHAFANRCANLFEAHGVEPGDRVAILLGQAVETAAANVACYKCGAVSVPLFTRFGLEDLEFRLNDAGAKVLVTDLDNFARVAAVRGRLPGLETVFTVDGGSGEGGGALDFRQEVERASDRYETRATRADDPAALLYTSGTTGSPKGVLHAHRVLLGHIPGMDFANDYLGQPGDRLWSPADWAWIGGLFDILMPAWYHGLPVVAAPRGDFDPEDAFAILARHRIRNTPLLPTMLKLMAQTPAAGRYETNLRSVFTGGEPVGDDVMAWAAETLGTSVNEIYGQTECNLVAGGCSALLERRPGAIGVPVPGHVVDVVDDDGTLVEPGGTGHIAVRQPDPVAMLSYWRRPEADAEKIVNGWLLTGDVGHKDDDGYLWFTGRADDVIASGGERFGPGRVEECLTAHPDVALAAVIGVPDPGPRRDREGVRGAARGSPAGGWRRRQGRGRKRRGGRERAPRRAPRPRPASAAGPRGSTGDRARRRAAAHDDGQDHASGAAAPGGGPPARGGPPEPRGAFSSPRRGPVRRAGRREGGPAIRRVGRNDSFRIG